MPKHMEPTGYGSDRIHALDSLRDALVSKTEAVAGDLHRIQDRVYSSREGLHSFHSKLEADDSDAEKVMTSMEVHYQK